MEDSIDDLDETARTIRATIFGLRLRACGPAASGLRARLVDVVDRAAALGGTFAARTRPEGGTELLWRVPLPGS
ncbi:hypothetical protein ACIRYZ_12525 [Kitasatospora sp. NPDC101155]|uniref:hypothetical protein n=1 Tax=Kitasatospora sp. NPDC101155 TaxID=3364097 RepID=UPI00380DB4AB